MAENVALIRARMKTPKAAATAGIVFSILMFAIIWLLRRSIPADPLEPGTWLAADTRKVELALNLIPIAGVAFLWFVAVLRDRFGEQEDRFFSTVFLGSSLLFLAMLFAAAAITGAVTLLASTTAEPGALIKSATFHFARVAAYIVANVYAIKMGAVFMFSTSTVVHPDRHRAALDGLPRICAGVGCSCRQLLRQLEPCSVARLGASNQHVYID